MQSPPDIMPMILALLSGAGFKDISKGIGQLSESGSDLTSLTSMPNAPMFMAGAGLKEAANSMEVLQPLMKMLMPPQPPPPPDPQGCNSCYANDGPQDGAGNMASKLRWGSADGWSSGRNAAEE